jgi:ABC-type iron transport system FetAB ATPase subunit
MRVAPYFGIYSIVVKTLPQLIEDMEAFALIKMRQLGLKPNDNIIITGGTPTGTGSTNFLRIVALNKLGDI